jgi:hypothetical protein
VSDASCRMGQKFLVAVGAGNAQRRDIC